MNISSVELVQAQPPAAVAQADPGPSGRLLWNAALMLAGFTYIAMALCLNLESPVFAVAFVTLAGYEVIGPRMSRRFRTC